MSISTRRRTSHLSRLGLAFLCVILVDSIALAQGSPLSAIITEIKHRVDKRLSERIPWQGAHLQDVLVTDNSVRTSPEAIAELTYGDGSVTRLAPDTTLTLQQQQNRILKLLLGKIWVRLSKGGLKTRIHTPTAIATIVGTDVLCEVTEDQTSTFTVLDTDPGHQLNVQAIDPISSTTVGRQSVASSAQQITVEPGQPAPPPHNVNVQQILQQEKGSGFLTEKQTATTAAASPAATGQPTAKPTDKPTGKPTEKPGEKPTEKPTEKPAERPTAQPTGRPTSEPTAQPTAAATTRPAETPATRTALQPTPQPASQPTAQPTAGPTTEPAVQPTAEPVSVVTPVPTAGPPILTPATVPEVAPTPGIIFDPLKDAPVLPSQELERTGSDVTGELNVIFEHDGPP